MLGHGRPGRVAVARDGPGKGIRAMKAAVPMRSPTAILVQPDGYPVHYGSSTGMRSEDVRGPPRTGYLEIERALRLLALGESDLWIAGKLLGVEHPTAAEAALLLRRGRRRPARPSSRPRCCGWREPPTAGGSAGFATRQGEPRCEGGRVCAALDAAVLPLLPPQRRAAPAPRPGLQPRQLPAHTGLAAGGRAVVARPRLREKLVKIGARIVRHGRYVVFQLAEVAVPRALFAEILRRIDRLRGPPMVAA